MEKLKVGSQNFNRDEMQGYSYPIEVFSDYRTCVCLNRDSGQTNRRLGKLQGQSVSYCGHSVYTASIVFSITARNVKPQGILLPRVVSSIKQYPP